MKICSHVSIKNDLLSGANGLSDIVNLASYKSGIFNLGTEFLALELGRTTAMGFNCLVLHPRAFTDKDVQHDIQRIAEGISVILETQWLDPKTNLYNEEITYLRGVSDAL